MTIDELIKRLKQYDGKPITLMEVCGTHTAAIAQNGLRSLISPKIQLVSGPGCPVCVTPAAYIDTLCDYAKKPDTLIATFGDMLKVPGVNGSLTDARAQGAKIKMVYSPLDALTLAWDHPDTTVYMAAVGFETTAPSYALLVLHAQKRGLTNLKLLTALKRMPPVLEQLCAQPNEIDGFIAPGHVSAILGSDSFLPLAQQSKKPYSIAGFEAKEVLAAIYDLVQQVTHGEHAVHNLYPSVVRREGNERARSYVSNIFEEGSAVWRGLGTIDRSGLYLKSEYSVFDAGSRYLTGDNMPAGCRCNDVLLGKLQPSECPLFGSICSPSSPVGPCMVSQEGACGIHYHYEQT